MAKFRLLVSAHPWRVGVVAGILLGLVIFGVILLVNSQNPAVASPAPVIVSQPAAPAVIEPAAPAAVVEESAPVALEPAAAEEVHNQPKVAESAAESLPVIMTISQMGGGAEIEGDWKNPNAAAVKIPLEDTRDWSGIHRKDGKPLFAVAFSSDPGTVTCNGTQYVFDKGFVGVCLTTEIESITVVTGWNPDNENWNVWAEKFVIPEDMEVDEAVKEILTEWQATQEKPNAFAILSDGSVFKLSEK